MIPGPPDKARNTDPHRCFPRSGRARMVRARPVPGETTVNDPFKPDPHPICPHCNSDNIVADAWAIWNGPTSCWNLHSTYDHGFCLDCETDIRHVMATTSETTPFD